MMKDDSLNHNVTANAESALATLAKAVSVVQQELDATMAKKDELLERRVQLYAAPLSPADVCQFVSELIDHRAAEYAQRLQSFGWIDKLMHAPARSGVPKRDSSPLCLEDAEHALSRRLEIERRSDAVSVGVLPIFLSHNEFQNWQYFFLGDAMKEKLRAEILKAPQIEAEGAGAPPMDERREEIHAITKEIAELDAKATQLRSEIARLSHPVLVSAKRLQGSKGVA